MSYNQLWGLAFWQNGNIQCKWGKNRVFSSQCSQFSLASMLQPPAASRVGWSSKSGAKLVFYTCNGAWARSASRYAMG